ncbi:hypothetical protein [Roseateles oligotrophus]|uniref:Lipoprotein n=1 Tax=Roseateles oligotrophus TaxID=1769250 RepID=A0ABT2YDA0_9BURK|nr:hypothetical protein [Roseateles oligotrophus]MCV2367975.1 hypothetical protein [Roseateles oligotrophus]
MNVRFASRSQGADSSGSTKLYGAVSTAALLSTLLLTACGGSIVDAIVDDLTCAVTNCKDSATLNVDEISPKFTITQDNGQVKVEGRLGYTANLITVVHPSGNDHMSASVGNQRRDLVDEDGKRTNYSVFLADASEQPIVTANFVRGSELHGSTVTMPKTFSVVAPLGTPLISRSSGKFLVQMSQPYTNQMGVSVSMVCKRVDGSSFDSKNEPLRSSPEGNGYRISTLDLDMALNHASVNFNPNSPNASLVQTCELTFQWMLSQTGTVASTLNRHSSIVAERRVKQTASYDARL